MKPGKSGSAEIVFPVGGFSMRIDWEETYDSAANVSVVSTKAYLKSTTYSGIWFPGGTISINGATVVTMSYTGTATHKTAGSVLNNYSEITYANGLTAGAPPWTSGEIAHNSDGSKRVVIAVNDFAVYRADGTTLDLGSGSATIDLTKINTGIACIGPDGAPYQPYVYNAATGAWELVAPFIYNAATSTWDACG